MKENNNQLPELLSIQQAAKVAGLGRNNLACFIKKALLPVVKLPGYNRIKIHRDDILNFINEHKYIHK